jgi:hypothetical protein
MDRSCASSLLALPSRVPPLLIYVHDSGICNRENWVFWRKFLRNKEPRGMIQTAKSENERHEISLHHESNPEDDHLKRQ